MGKIQVLDRHTAELIAAGEVVDRPASVIKELVENAIDAGATSITVETQNGGTTLMRLTDNGTGLEREDIPTAFLRHATSKVRSEADLEAISTLGFRGEALASIAAVSKVEVLTFTGREPTGYRYVIQGGEEVFFEEAGCPRGTTIYVRELFYNTPARMKFLKKDVTEANAISGMLDRIALSHPEISIRLLRDRKEELRTPGDGKLKSAVFAVYGREFTENLLEVDYALNGVVVKGYVGKPAAARPNRNMQVFFLNGRYVKTLTGMAALEQAFKGAIMTGKFPACVLHLEVPPEAVDVNVHPAKIEVRFSNEKPIFDAVYHAVKSALLTGDKPDELTLPSPVAKPPAPVTPLSADEVQTRLSDIASQRKTTAAREFSVLPGIPVGNPDAWTPAPPPPPVRYTPPTVLPDIDVQEEDVEPPVSPPQTQVVSVRAVVQEAQPAPSPIKEEIPICFVGEAFTTYAIFEAGDKLIFLDKHAAHERLLYERLKNTQEQPEAQMLLSPITITLPKEEFAALLEHRALLDSAGFELEEFGPGTVLVRAVPSMLDQEDVAGQVAELAGGLLTESRAVTTGQLDWIYHNIACRAAIKAGTGSSPEELLTLAREALDNPDARYCPHGRPTSMVLTRKGLEKQFGRIQ